MAIFTIGQAAFLLGVSASTLRNWEAQGLIPKAVRTGLCKKRVYTNDQIREIREYIEGRQVAA